MNNNHCYEQGRHSKDKFASSFTTLPSPFLLKVMLEGKLLSS
jgi:hypothetical protein